MVVELTETESREAVLREAVKAVVVFHFPPLCFFLLFDSSFLRERGFRNGEMRDGSNYN